ncbi:MAG: rRNA pseudouridine synthase [Desulfobulbaceae bacterium]|uniref:Pseudouridine synthase n=1 Tax=Candidatus Desulfatifera sulfidica TaxID=2841691 RepID=A0A8J6NCH5_9BACT|nr:rRNA pseudouridine synthase [Candidatus Desulfatifera sulfidica]
MSKPIRLQKFLADCGICSRRKAEEYIQNGQVKVDGQVITTMGVTVDPKTQEVRFKNRIVSKQAPPIYILLHKPTGYVTTLSDPQGRPMVTDLVAGISTRIFPVGRLDLDTSGALLLTNDGQLAQQIQHPSHEVTKTYEAFVSGRPAYEKLNQLRHGIMLEGRMTAPATLQVKGQEGKLTRIEITIHEGRKRQVRKMFQAVGHPVIELKRIAYGQLQLGNLNVGKYRLLGAEEIKKIFLKKIPLQKKK